MRRMSGSRGSLGWFIVDYSAQVQHAWVVSCFFILGEGWVPIYLGSLSSISLVGKFEDYEVFCQWSWVLAYQ
jgi:hypothetical protein